MKLYIIRLTKDNGEVSFASNGLRVNKYAKGWGSVGAFKNAIRNAADSVWNTDATFETWVDDYLNSGYSAVEIQIADFENSKFEIYDAKTWYFLNMGYPHWYKKKHGLLEK